MRPLGPSVRLWLKASLQTTVRAASELLLAFKKMSVAKSHSDVLSLSYPELCKGLNPTYQTKYMSSNFAAVTKLKNKEGVRGMPKPDALYWISNQVLLRNGYQ